jgi:hypothetical protein
VQYYSETKNVLKTIIIHGEWFAAIPKIRRQQKARAKSFCVGTPMNSGLAKSVCVAQIKTTSFLA